MPNAQLWIHNHTQDDLKKKSISIVLDIAFMNNTYKNTDVLQRPVLLAFRISCISKQSETDWVEKDSERFYFYSREVVGFLSFHSRGEESSKQVRRRVVGQGSKRKMQGTILSGGFTHRRNSLALQADQEVVVLKIKISVKWQSSDSERKGMWKKQLSFFIILFRFVNKSLKGPDLSL
ncbi:hypothetical protein ACJX0J_001060, partial (mitochondrion) [Zea mays]